MGLDGLSKRPVADPEQNAIGIAAEDFVLRLDEIEHTLFGQKIADEKRDAGVLGQTQPRSDRGPPLGGRLVHPREVDPVEKRAHSPGRRRDFVDNHLTDERGHRQPQIDIGGLRTPP